MTENNQQEISLAGGIEAVVRYGGTTVKLHPGGDIDVHTSGDVNAYTEGAVRKLREIRSPQIGDKMPAGHPNAGWIYGGISKTTHQPFYVAPKDSGVFKWKEAMAFAAKDGARLPSQDELDQIYEARNKGALKDTFNVTGSLSAGWYWSSRYNVNYGAWAQRFSDGYQSYSYKDSDSSLRCVR